MGPIGRSSLNALAAAWRSETLQSVAGDSASRSAIVAPLLGVDRCIGVLAIEVPPGREADGPTKAVTTLIAAQLATVLGAWPARQLHGANRSPAVRTNQRLKLAKSPARRDERRCVFVPASSPSM